MKLIHTLTALAVAAAVTIAGCSNTFSGTDTDASILREFNSGNRTSTFATLQPTMNSWAPGSPTQDSKQTLYLEVDSDASIDIDSILEAITFRNTSDAASDDAVLVQGTVVPYTIKGSSDDGTYTIVYLELNLTGTSDFIEAFIDATKLTGKNGALLMDSDGDYIQGEKNDDDLYFYIITTSSPTAPVGVARNPDVGMDLNTVGFSMVGTPSPTTLTTYDTFELVYNRSTAGSKTDIFDYKTLFDATIVIETYNMTTNTWTSIESTSTYDTTTGLYTVTFTALLDGETVRARITDVQNLKTNGTWYGFVQRYTMDQNEKTDVINSARAIDSTASGGQIPLAAQDVVFSSTNAVYDANNRNGYIVIDLNTATGSTIGDLGLNESTFTTDNVKLYVTSGPSEGVPISYTPSFRFDPAENIPASGPKTQVVLTLDSSHVFGGSNIKIFAGPGLRSLGDETPGTNPRRFGDLTNIDITEELRGFHDTGTVAGVY